MEELQVVPDLYCLHQGCTGQMLKVGGGRVCSRIYDYWMQHPTHDHVSHAMLPRKETQIVPGLGEVRVEYTLGAKVELPPGNRDCTVCGRVNLGWCPYCTKTYCANQNCIEGHASQCPGLRDALRPAPKMGLPEKKVRVDIRQWLRKGKGPKKRK